MRRLRFAIGLLLVLPPFALAWDSPGHALVGRIAWDGLNPKARAAVARFAAEMEAPVGVYTPAELACWMDDLRDPNSRLPDRGRFLSWHYINLDLSPLPGDAAPPLEPGRDNDMAGNAVTGFKRARAVLLGGTDPYVRNRAMACAIVMHLVGDIHQPLHATSRGHDRGGNLVAVLNGPEGAADYNLHYFWDAAYRASLDPQTGRIVIDPHYGAWNTHSDAVAAPLASQWEKRLTPADDSPTDFEAWMRESHHVGETVAYAGLPAGEPVRLDPAYVARARAAAQERILLAGRRLAALLNAWLGSDTPPSPPPPYPAGPPARLPLS